MLSMTSRAQVMQKVAASSRSRMSVSTSRSKSEYSADAVFRQLGSQADIALIQNDAAAVKGPWCARRDSNPHDVTHCHLKAARLPVPPRALGRPAYRSSRPGRINGADVTNREWGYKTRDDLDSTEIWAGFGICRMIPT